MNITEISCRPTSIARSLILLHASWVRAFPFLSFVQLRPESSITRMRQGKEECQKIAEPNRPTFTAPQILCSNIF